MCDNRLWRGPGYPASEKLMGTSLVRLGDHAMIFEPT